MSISVKSYCAVAEFDASDSNEEFIASDFARLEGGVVVGVVADGDMSSPLFAYVCLFFLTFSISDPIGTKVRARYFLAPSSPVSLLWL